MGNVKLPIESGKYFKERTEFVNYVFIKKNVAWISLLIQMYCMYITFKGYHVLISNSYVSKFDIQFNVTNNNKLLTICKLVDTLIEGVSSLV